MRRQSRLELRKININKVSTSPDWYFTSCQQVLRLVIPNLKLERSVYFVPWGCGNNHANGKRLTMYTRYFSIDNDLCVLLATVIDAVMRLDLYMQQRARCRRRRLKSASRLEVGRAAAWSAPCMVCGDSSLQYPASYGLPHHLGMSVWLPESPPISACAVAVALTLIRYRIRREHVHDMLKLKGQSQHHVVVLHQTESCVHRLAAVTEMDVALIGDPCRCSAPTRTDGRNDNPY